MHIKSLLLRNFRSYQEGYVQFSSGTNCIVGHNGKGKTNLLEAISLVSTGRSFRTTQLQEMIRFGESFFYLEATFEKSGIEHTVKIYYSKASKKIEIDETNHSSFHSLLGILPSVILTPDDLAFIIGSPQERRRFLDLFISQTDRLYLYHLGRYFKALKERNHLLKQETLDETICTFEAVMAESASYLIKARSQAIDTLQQRLKPWGNKLSLGQEEISLLYQTKPKELLFADSIQESLKEQFQTLREKEMIVGHTLSGPHRDDLLLHQDEQLSKKFASQGQRRSFLAALRFAEWECMAELLENKPLLGIDDLGTQLDPKRKEELTSCLSTFNQVIITAPTTLSFNCHQIPIEELDFTPMHS